MLLVSAVQNSVEECPAQQWPQPPAARMEVPPSPESPPEPVPATAAIAGPSTMNSNSAVPRSTTHTIGGSGVAKAPMASEMPAMAKARASRFLENLRIFEIGVPALVACSLGPLGGGAIWFAPPSTPMNCRRFIGHPRADNLSPRATAYPHGPSRARLHACDPTHTQRTLAPWSPCRA
jgi:hypothetical protein